MTELERRYHRLLRAYPAEYRRARGAEIVGTYLDLARPGQRRPSPGDVADLVLGGLRQRLRAAGAADLTTGVRLAAVLALVATSALAAGWSVAELHRLPEDLAAPGFGPVHSTGALAWGAWLLAAALALTTTGRTVRTAVAVALVLTVAVVPVRALAGLPRPPLLVLLPQLTLGLLALGLPHRLPRSARVAVAVATAAGALLAAELLRTPGWWAYHGPIRELPPIAGATLLTVALAIGAGLAARRDGRGGWALLLLLTPVGLLSLSRIAFGVGADTVPSLIGVTVLVGLLGPAALAAALAVRRRARADRSAHEPAR
ncbi:hypothetical protein [Micromonospora auratinigra]|uniref:Uncharacterized protein n=1 Tax=Micromonospora auratinigra TaxID=261654 RepID=A0A1A8ZMS7_9ACTN|nr:hypothetical protein [Micromonospora auratinigra]SBT45172.1 hypothetical protein GA0070611_2939 [Micromonospora auratinigra]